jgi:glycosyltransferase involved in cell wall biosynthesis
MEPALGALLLKKLLRIPVILHIGDILSAYLFYYDSKLLRMFSRFFIYIERRMPQNTDKILVVSNALKGFLIKGGISSEKISVVGEGVDIRRFSTQIDVSEIKDLYDLWNKPVVMFHGAIEPYQGVEDIVKAAPIILRKIPNAKFVIVGSGSAVSKIKKLVAQLSLNESFIFTGWVSEGDLPKLIASCDVGVIPRPSGLANDMVITGKLLQYWASGKPIVASRLKAISESVEDGKSGLLYTPGDFRELAEKVLVLLENPNAAKEMGVIGRKLIEQKYSWEVVGNRIVKEIENLHGTYHNLHGFSV